MCLKDLQGSQEMGRGWEEWLQHQQGGQSTKKEEDEEAVFAYQINLFTLNTIKKQHVSTVNKSVNEGTCRKELPEEGQEAVKCVVCLGAWGRGERGGSKGKAT